MRTQFKKAHIKSYLCGALLVGAGLIPSAALAQDPTLAPPDTGVGEVGEDAEPTIGVAAEESIEESALENDKNWSVSATLSTRIYQGMFVDLANESDEFSSPNAIDPGYSFSRWSNVYSLGAGYKLSDFNFGARVSWSHLMTPGGGALEQYEFRFHDVSLSAGWSGYTIDAIDTTVTASYGLSLPTSMSSQASNRIVGNSLGVGISRTFLDTITLSYRLGGGWTPHTTTAPTDDPEDVQIYREDEIVGNEVATVGGYNTQFSLSNSLSASFPIWEKLSGSVSYSLSKYWSYAHDTDDGYSANIEGIQTGRNTGDAVSASLGLSYPIGNHVHLSGGISSSQRPKTSDNKSFRFPWWNFAGAAANRSSINFSVTGTY
jgi:hypothetical protein